MATTRDTALDPVTVDSLDHSSLDVTRWNYDPATGLLTQKLYDDGKRPSYTYTPDGKLACILHETHPEKEILYL